MRQFILSQIANFSATIAGSITFIALPWLAFELTHSSVQSAITLACTSFPVILLSPFMGSLIDRYGRRRVAYLGEVASAVSVVLVPIFHDAMGMNLVLLIVLSTIKMFFAPTSQTARKALLPDIAHHAKFTLDRANSIHESIFAAGFASGPALAAILIDQIDVYAAFWAAGITAIISAVAAWLIRVTEKQEHDPNEEKGNAFVFAIQGLKTLVRIRVLGVVFLGFLLLSLIYIPVEMVILPRYYNETGNASGLGLLIATMAGFSTLTTLGFEWLHKRVGYANILRIALVGVSVALIPMSLLPSQWAMLALGAVLGGVWGPIAPLLNTIIQKLVAANMRGRVFSLEMMMWNIAPLTSFIVVGLCLDAFGVRPVYFVISLLMLVGSVSVALAPRLRDLKAIEKD